MKQSVLLPGLVALSLACGGRSEEPLAGTPLTPGVGTSAGAGGSAAAGGAGRGGSSSGGSSSGVGAGTGGSTSEPPEVPTLCDGSDDVRVAFVSGGGFVDEYYAFSSVYGYAFFALDGRCRFWQGKYADGHVYAGTLTPDAAQEFARSLHFGELSAWTSVPQAFCDDAGGRVLWTGEGKIVCSCQCTENPGAPAGWTQAFSAAFSAEERVFADAQSVTGSARVLLVPIDDPHRDPDAVPWPLARPPSSAELLVTEPGGYPAIDESSGAAIDNPEELALLRGARDQYARTHEYAERTPLRWTNPDSQSEVQLYLLLRDETPANVYTALARAWD